MILDAYPHAEPDYDYYPDDELTGEAEHQRDAGVSTEAEVHRFWHRLNGSAADGAGCPWDACQPDDDRDYGPAWSGQWIDSPDYCSGEHTGEEPPF